LKIKISIIGIGTIGSNHLRVLSEMKDVKIDYIFDKNVNRVKKLSKIYKINFTKNLEDIKKSSVAVIIATPTNTHFEYIKYFSDLKIFVEKPMVTNVKQALKVKKILKKNQLQCGFIERFNAVTPIIKKIIKSKKVISIDFKRTDKLSSRITDVDVILDLMIHDIDLAVFLNGKIKKISAYGFKEKNQISYASVILFHKNKTISHLEASKITQKKIRNINLTTTDSYVSADLLTKEVTINTQTTLDNKTITSQNYKNLTLNLKQERVIVNQKEALRNELETFINFCKKSNLKIPNIQESLYCLSIAEKIKNEINKKL